MSLSWTKGIIALKSNNSGSCFQIRVTWPAGKIGSRPSEELALAEHNPLARVADLICQRNAGLVSAQDRDVEFLHLNPPIAFLIPVAQACDSTSRRSRRSIRSSSPPGDQE
jgi:hypothetical protein